MPHRRETGAGGFLADIFLTEQEVQEIVSSNVVTADEVPFAVVRLKKV